MRQRLPFLAQNGNGAMSAIAPLLGEKRSDIDIVKPSRMTNETSDVPQNIVPSTGPKSPSVELGRYTVASRFGAAVLQSYFLVFLGEHFMTFSKRHPPWNDRGLATGVGAAAVISSGTFISGARGQIRAKTFILVPEALSAGPVLRRVSDRLEKQGHKVYSLSLTGLGDRVASPGARI